jgi:predicted nucleic acid-binding protein
MPKPRVYVETTIPNFYYDFRKSPAITMRREATRQWWQTAAERYELVTSTFVHAELNAGSSAAVHARLQLLSGIPNMKALPEIDEVVETYLLNKLMPAKPIGDAMHLALASYYECHFIVTWNCRHLANPNKAVHIARINTRLGLGVPRLVTPLDLLKGGPDEG